MVVAVAFPVVVVAAVAVAGGNDNPYSISDARVTMTIFDGRTIYE